MGTIRLAGPGDVAAVVQLVTSAYRGEASRAGWTTEADWLDGQRTDPGEILGLVEDPDSEILLVEGDPAVAPGLLASCQVSRRPGRVAYFGMFAVRPARQGRGTGRVLLAEAERWASRRWGATTMRMTVISVRSELIAWYERRGYRRTGETEPFPYGDPAFGVPRVEGLRFAVLTKRIGPG